MAVLQYPIEPREDNHTPSNHPRANGLHNATVSTPRRGRGAAWSSATGRCGGGGTVRSEDFDIRDVKVRIVIVRAVQVDHIFEILPSCHERAQGCDLAT